MMPLRTQVNSDTSVKYHKLDNNDEQYTDLQFRKPPSKVPYKAICLAVCLFVLGTIMLVIGVMLFTGYIDVKYADRTWPVLVLGSILFIPGFYHTAIAYYAWRGYRGYSFDDIPSYD